MNIVVEHFKKHPGAEKHQKDIMGEIMLLKRLPYLMISAYKREDELYSESIYEIYNRVYYDSLNIIKNRLLALLKETLGLKNSKPGTIKLCLKNKDEQLLTLLCEFIDDKKFNERLTKRHSIHHEHHLMHDNEINERAAMGNIIFDSILSEIAGGGEKPFKYDEYIESKQIEIFKSMRKLKIDIGRQCVDIEKKYVKILTHLVGKY